MLALRSPLLRITLRSLFETSHRKLNQPLKCTFTCTSAWLRPVAGNDGAEPRPNSAPFQDNSRFWTPEEIDTLKRLRSQGMTPREMMPHIPRRSLSSIRSQSNLMYGKFRGWLLAEQEILVASVQEGLSVDAIQAQLPNRTRASVNSAIRRLQAGSTGSKIIPWTDDERRQLIKLRSDHTMHEIHAAHFPHRTYRSIKKELSRLTVRSPSATDIRLRIPRPWTQDDVNKLHDLHSQGVEKKEICKILDRHPAALSRKSEELGLKLKHSKRQRRIPWTEEDDAILLPLIKQSMSRSTVKNLFTYRSFESVAKRMATLRSREGLTRSHKPWTEEDNTELRRLIALGHTASEISQSLDRDLTAIAYRTSRLKAVTYVGLRRNKG